MSITIDDLRNNRDKSYKFLLNNSYHIETQYKDVLFYFLGKEIEENPSNMGDYTICPEWGDASSDFRMRFIIVKSDNDYSLVVLKVVTPFTENYLRIDYPIVSIYHNETSSKVLRVLKMYKGIHFYSVISENKDGRRYNYYNTLEDFESKMNKSKWKSKKGINKLSKIIDVVSCDDISIDKARGMFDFLFDFWNKSKGESVSSKTERRLLDITYRIRGGKALTFWYKEILVGIIIASPIYDRFITVYTQKSVGIATIDFLSEYLKSYDVAADIQRYLGSYIQYYIHKHFLVDLGYEALFYTGDLNSKNLKRFKEIYYNNAVCYKRLALKEYVEGMN